MSTEVESKGSEVVAYMLIDANEIGLPEITNVRPFSSKQGSENEREIASINDLMTSIEEEGQIEPVVVVPVKDPKPGEPKFNAVAGRRRVRAIQMHNLSSDKPMLVKAVLSDPVKAISQLFRRAAHENLMRQQITPIDFAYCIREVRKNMKWGAASHTKKVAEFFKCSEAQITQHEKLFDLEETFQQALADGTLKLDGAYALLKIKGREKRQEVYDAAAKKQKAELGELAIARSLDSTSKDTDAPVAKKTGKKSGGAKAGGVKSKHIKAAAREADPTVKQARTKKDVVEFFESCQGPAYGYEDGAVYLFVENFKKWIKGDLSNRTLDKYFEVMVEKAPRGTAPKREDKK